MGTRVKEGAAVIAISGSCDGVWGDLTEGADEMLDSEPSEGAGVLVVEGTVPGDASDDIGAWVLPGLSCSEFKLVGLSDGVQTSLGMKSFEGTMVSDGAEVASGPDTVKPVGAGVAVETDVVGVSVSTWLASCGLAEGVEIPPSPGRVEPVGG